MHQRCPSTLLPCYYYYYVNMSFREAYQHKEGYLFSPAARKPSLSLPLHLWMMKALQRNLKRAVALVIIRPVASCPSYVHTQRVFLGSDTPVYARDLSPIRWYYWCVKEWPSLPPKHWWEVIHTVFSLRCKESFPLSHRTHIIPRIFLSSACFLRYLNSVSGYSSISTYSEKV